VATCVASCRSLGSAEQSLSVTGPGALAVPRLLSLHSHVIRLS